MRQVQNPGVHVRGAGQGCCLHRAQDGHVVEGDDSYGDSLLTDVQNAGKKGVVSDESFGEYDLRGPVAVADGSRDRQAVGGCGHQRLRGVGPSPGALGTTTWPLSHSSGSLNRSFRWGSHCSWYSTAAIASGNAAARCTAGSSDRPCGQTGTPAAAASATKPTATVRPPQPTTSIVSAPRLGNASSSFGSSPR